MVKSRNDFDALINLATAIEDAKKLQYNGKDLEDSEKDIFNNSLLVEKKPDGSEEVKLDAIKDTAALLDNLKKAQAELENEKKLTDLNLSVPGGLLLEEFLENHRNKTIAYQAIEDKKPGEIKKILDDYQTLQYRRVNRGLEAKKKAIMTSLSSIKSKSAEKDTEVKKALKAFEKVSEEGKKKGYKNVLQEAVAYQTQGENIVKALKDDIDKTKGAHVGYNILKAAIDTQKKVADVIYRKDSSALVPEALGSIIETSVVSPYSDKKFAHPNYLGEGLPWQMRKLFEQFDKDKLFTLIDDNFSHAEAKKIKTSYERVLGAFVEAKDKIEGDEERLADNGKDFSMTVLYPKDIPGYEEVEGSEVLIPRTPGEARKWGLYLTDVIYFMNSLFPKGTADFANGIEFLKPGAKALPFKDSAHTLDTKQDIYWRGREDNTLGIAGDYRDKFPNRRFPRHLSFDSTKLSLSWAGAKGQSIPEFFWQVYDKAEAIDFTGSNKYLTKDGSVGEFFKNDLSVYEQKLFAYQVGSRIDPYLMSYSERVKDIISGKFPIAGYTIEEFDKDDSTKQKGLDGEKVWTDFEKTCHKILTHVHRSFHEFRKVADRINYSVVLASADKKLVVPYMIEGTKSDIDNDIINIWDEMNSIFEGKVDNAKKLRDAWVNKIDERTSLNAQEVTEKRKLEKLENSYKAIEDGKYDQLKAQLESLGKKLTTAITETSITYREAMAMHALLFVVEEHEGVTTAITTYKNNLKTWETIRAGSMQRYGSFKRMGGSFSERLSNWKNNEGKNLSEEAIRAFFDLVKLDLQKEEESSGISPEEKADLVAINNYIDTDKQPKLRASQLEIIFAIDTSISQELVDKWNNYGDEKKFKADSKHLKNIVDIINNLSDKEPFFTELKAYLTGKSGVPAFPGDTAIEQDKLNYYYTLVPEHVIGAFAAWKIKTDADEKKKIEDEMKDKKDANNIPLSKDKETGYGDGTKFTDEGIIKYFSEKTGGIKHSYRKQKHNDDKDKKGKGFWSWENPSAIIAGGFLIVGTGLVLAGIIWWEKLAAWWDGPADAEGNGDNDEDDDKK